MADHLKVLKYDICFLKAYLDINIKKNRLEEDWSVFQETSWLQIFQGSLWETDYIGPEYIGFWWNEGRNHAGVERSRQIWNMIWRWNWQELIIRCESEEGATDEFQIFGMVSSSIWDKESLGE